MDGGRRFRTPMSSPEYRPKQKKSRRASGVRNETIGREVKRPPYYTQRTQPGGRTEEGLCQRLRGTTRDLTRDPYVAGVLSGRVRRCDFRAPGKKVSRAIHRPGNDLRSLLSSPPLPQPGTGESRLPDTPSGCFPTLSYDSPVSS